MCPLNLIPKTLPVSPMTCYSFCMLFNIHIHKLVIGLCFVLRVHKNIFFKVLSSSMEILMLYFLKALCSISVRTNSLIEAHCHLPLDRNCHSRFCWWQHDHLPRLLWFEMNIVLRVRRLLVSSIVPGPNVIAFIYFSHLI